MRDVIIGHTVKKRNSGFATVLLVAISIILFVLITIFLDTTGQNVKVAKEEPKTSTTIETTTTTVLTRVLPEPVKENVQISPVPVSSVSVVEKIFCRQIIGNLPNGPADKFNSGEKAHFYTRILSETTPFHVKHIWVNPAGKIHTIIDLYVRNKPGDIWSYIVLPPQAGVWTARVAAGDRIIAEAQFQVE